MPASSSYSQKFSAPQLVRPTLAGSPSAVSRTLFFWRTLCQYSGLLTILLAAWSTHALAAEIDLPHVDPTFTIRVEADSYASLQRGSYDVLAFEGNCVLRQGKLEARADEIILWIEKNVMLTEEHPGKVICFLNGNAELDWGNGQRLKDHRWMGRLFSVHPISVEGGQQVARYDIPHLDWQREPGVFMAAPNPVQPAQFSQSLGNVPQAANDAAFAAPPLLSQQASAAPNNTAAPARVAPATPGAVTWNPQAQASGGSTRDSQFLPPGGLVIGEDGTAPSADLGRPETVTALPAVPPRPEELAPAFPQQTQIVQQVPVPAPFAAKNVQFLPRGNISPEITFSPYDPNRKESVLQIRGGFKLVVQGIQVASQSGEVVDYGTVSLEADNAVVWVRSDGPVNPLEGFSSTADRPIELYLEGNIVFFQGNRVIYAERMYYNVSSEYGMVLSAEVLTPVPQYRGLLRLKADVLQQRDSRNFKAFGAAVTSSRMGVPKYWLQSDEVEFQDNRTEEDLSVFAPTDPNRPTELSLSTRGNHAYVGGVPVFFWPSMKTDLNKPSFYLTNLKFKSDSIFGTQVLADWDLYQLLGIQPHDNSNWTVSTDYLSERGPAIGTHFDYNAPTWLFGVPGIGTSDSWFIRDSGLDTLGIDRQNLVPEKKTRGRSFSRHRLFLSQNWELLGEWGWISDRNFLEQYFENEWEQQKDFTTALRARRYNGNRLFEVYGQTRVNEFFTETEWFPRINHYWLGQDLLGERLTWSASSSVGYGKQRVASTPTDPQDAAKFQLRPWETNSEGVRALTRQELALPFSMGAFKMVPFLSGEAGFWKQDVNQEDVTRLTGQIGWRSSLPMWRVNPNVENRLFDLRGMAHKMTFESEVFYADSNQDLARFPLYDPLDDNAQEHFRRRFVFNTFGGALPPQFDERGYALRTGMQRWITASSPEIADDLSQVRFGLDNRWQTKRGLPGRERIVDLVSLDTDFIYFPQEDRDNFGESFGGFNYDLRYNVGDRLTLLSDGYFDVFSQGLKALSAGAQISRPGKGNAYIGLLSLEGPISARVLNGFVNYRMNDKWIFSGGAAYDFGDTGSIGQNLALTRIGESALVRVGMNLDRGRDNVSFNFAIEPRFLSGGVLGSLGGELIPPAGLFGLE
ncbi:MAG: organic solvent tolerance protein OstA [bacterium]|nr:organic solvent tolerance protein OstA [bacterium]